MAEILSPYSEKYESQTESLRWNSRPFIYSTSSRISSHTHTHTQTYTHTHTHTHISLRMSVSQILKQRRVIRAFSLTLFLFSISPLLFSHLSKIAKKRTSRPFFSFSGLHLCAAKKLFISRAKEKIVPLVGIINLKTKSFKRTYRHFLLLTSFADYKI